MSAKLPIHWLTQEPPLTPEGVVAQGVTAHRLAERTLSRSLSSLRVLATADLLVLLGPSEDLPWVDGVYYIARSPEVKALFLPTTLRCDPHPQLVLKHLQQRVGTGPVLVLPPLGLFISLEGASPIYAPSLQNWLSL